MNDPDAKKHKSNDFLHRKLKGSGAVAITNTYRLNNEDKKQIKN